MMNKDWRFVAVPSPQQGWRLPLEWCSEQFGQQQLTWYYVGEGVFNFAREEDAVLFTLRWS
jgi:hypothetical protein